MMIYKLLLPLYFLSPTVTALLCYISPASVEGEACTVSDKNTTLTLAPCFTLENISEDTTSSLLSDLTLVLLPGTHAIHHTLRFSNLRSLELLAWEEHPVVVWGQHPQAGLVFDAIRRLEIDSLRFVSCPLQCSNLPTGLVRLIKLQIHNCAFIESKHDYAVSINQTKWQPNYLNRLDISITHAEFLSNHGGIFCNISNQIMTSLHIVKSKFVSNMGGALHCQGAKSLIVQNSEFTNNSAKLGGAIFISLSSVTIIATVFQGNTALSEDGGAIYLDNYYLTIDKCTFNNNSAKSSGGAIYSIVESLHINESIFVNNSSGEFGGAVLCKFYEDNITARDCLFQRNIAKRGGALYLWTPYNSYSLLDNSTFSMNSALIAGGAVYLDNYKIDHIGMSCCSFKYNRAGVSGGAVHCSCSNILLERGFEAIGNTAVNGGAIYAENTSISVLGKSSIPSVCADKILIADNTAKSKGGALYLNNSYFKTTKYIVFGRNIVLSPKGQGGAIYVYSNCSSKQCFLTNSNGTLEFVNNSAAYGSVLYGGLLDRCLPDTDNHSLLGINYFKQVSEYEHSALAVTSDQVQLCLCYNDTQMDCTTRELSVSKMRGESVSLMAISLDQDSKAGLSVVRAYYVEPLAELDVGEWRKTVNRKCTQLSYHIFTVEPSATLVLQLLGDCEDSPPSILTVRINLTSCTRGFEQSNDRCICERRLLDYFDHCNIDTHTVTRRGASWLRYDKHHLRITKSCPLNYCNMSLESISLLSPDEQCASHRSGVTCGACRENYSIALGGNSCLRCTSGFTPIWLTVVFAVAGMALVALLLLCNMTISTGTLNGLIFYANVVSISGLTSPRNCSINPLLSVFIAWVNLDLGVETCYYPGMNTYHKTWVQFAFPLYIWLLVGCIIVASYYSSRAMRLFGRNNIAILATLFILAYTKLLKTIIIALSATRVLKGDADNMTARLTPYKVWTFDGNMEYLGDRHRPLFAVALLFLLFLFLPYTLLLTFGQCARSVPMRRCRCILRLTRSTTFVSILDAYHAPYNRRHRYWTGLMLLTRCALFLASASSSSGDNTLLVHMYITTLVVVKILVVKVFVTRIYKSTLVSVLEVCFLLNLLVLSTTLTFIEGSNSLRGSHTSCRISNASISISLVFFLFILTYHASLQIQKSNIYAHVKDKFLSRKLLRHHTATEDKLHLPTRRPNIPTTTLVELREELLASEQHAKK